MIDSIIPNDPSHVPGDVAVSASEEEPTGVGWMVIAYAVLAEKVSPTAEA